MSDRKQRLKRNKWKKAFYSLLIFNGIVFVVLLALLFGPVPENKAPVRHERGDQESSEFIIRTSKQNLNNLVNAYIEQLLGDSDHYYRISLDEDVHLIGELPVFSTTVPLSVHFEPLVQDNGDLILKQKSISVGLLELPNKKIMEYMADLLPMPEWVTVNPQEQEIYVAVTDMDIRSNFHVAVETIDLEANNLAFRLKIPYETLGLEMLSPW